MKRLVDIAAGLLLSLIAGPAWSQPLTEALPPAKLPGESAVVARRLVEVQKRAEQEQWPEIVDEYQRLLEEAGDALVPLDPERPTHCVQVRRLCHARLAALPPAARRLYRARVDDQARQWLDQGIERRDPVLLRRLVEQAFCSRHTERALDLLGDLAFEHGDYEQAEHWWRMLARPASASQEKSAELDLRFPDPQNSVAPVRAKLILCELYRGRVENAKHALPAFRKLHADAEGQLAGQNGNLAAILETAVKHADAVAPPADDRSWPTFAGDTARNGRSPTAPHGRWLEEPWRVPLRNRLPNETKNILTPSRAAQACVYCPVISEGKVVLADARTVTVYDLFTGRRIGDCDLGQDLKNAGFFPDGNQLTPLGVRYTLTVAGGRIFARLGSRTLGDPRLMGANPRAEPFENVEFRTESYLVCLGMHPDEHGKLPCYWQLRARRLDSEPATFFEGAPLVLAGRAYIARTLFNDSVARTFIDCYDAETGVARWRQEVCEVREAGDGRSRLQHHLLTAAGPNVVYCSHSGAVIALNALSGKWAWAVRYPRRGDRLADGLPVPRDLAPCVAADGRVFVAPRDAERIYCFDADSGRTLWESQAIEVMQVLGVAHGRLIFTTGKQPLGIRALEVATGRDLRGWLQPEDGASEPTIGRGLLAGTHVFWPTQHGLRVLNQDDGQVASDVFVPADNPIRGNLAVGHGCLVVATAKELLGYVPERFRLEQRRKEADRSGAAEPKYRLAVALADAGKTAEALETLPRATTLTQPEIRVGHASLSEACRVLRRQLLFKQVTDLEERKHWDEAAELLTKLAPDSSPSVQLQTLARKARLWEKAGKPEQAVDAWQAMLMDERLRSTICLELDTGRAGALAERHIMQLIATHGREIYAHIEAQARRKLAELSGADPHRLYWLMETFPNSAAAQEAFNLLPASAETSLFTTRGLLCRSPAEDGPWDQLALTHEKRKDWEAARSAWQRLRQLSGDRTLKSLGSDLTVSQFVAEKFQRPPYRAEHAPVAPDLPMPLARSWQARLSNGELLAAVNSSGAGDCPFFLVQEPQGLMCRVWATGELLWSDRSREHQISWTGRHGDLVLAAGPRSVFCRRASVGGLSWVFDNPGEAALSDFQLAGGCVLLMQGRKRLWAIDVETGQVRWEHWAPAAQLDLPEPGGCFAPFFYAGNERTLVQTGRGSCWILDTLTGKRLHEFDSGLKAWPQPPVPLTEQRVCVVPDTRHVAVVHLAAGKEVWRHALGRDVSLTGEPPQVAGTAETLLVRVRRNFGDELQCLDPATGSVRWTRPVPHDSDLNLSRALVEREAAYLVMGNLLRAISLTDGQPLWSRPMTGAEGPWSVRGTRQYLLAFPATAQPELDIAHALRHFQLANPAALVPTQALLPLASALPSILAVRKQAESASRFPLLVIDRKDGQLIQRVNIASQGPQATLLLGAHGLLIGTADAVWALH
jgi:outer membrane protein assembly factor BamB/tetratricopeptide (TPR) repeat protein